MYLRQATGSLAQFDLKEAQSSAVRSGTLSSAEKQNQGIPGINHCSCLREIVTARRFIRISKYSSWRPPNKGLVKFKEEHINTPERSKIDLRATQFPSDLSKSYLLSKCLSRGYSAN